jgi:hypothetical protein
MAYLAGNTIGIIDDNVEKPLDPYTLGYEKGFKIMNEKLKEKTDKHIPQIYELYNSGLSASKIGKQLGIGKTTVKRVLEREWGIKPINRHKDVNGNDLEFWSDKYKPWHEEWLRLFKEEGMILNHIVKKYNVPDTSVAKFLQSSMSTKEYLEICKKNRMGSKLKYKHFVPEWEKLRQEGMSFSKIGKMYNVKGDTVATNLRGYDTRNIIK